jgi:hypothetical protein
VKYPRARLQRKLILLRTFAFINSNPVFSKLHEFEVAEEILSINLLEETEMQEIL